MNNLLMIAIASPFLAALIAPALAKRFQSRAAWLLAAVPLWMLVHFLGYVGDVSAGGVEVASVEWVPAFAVNFSFYIDGLSVLFAILITGIGTLIIAYSGGYLGNHPQFGRFVSFMFLFMGSMLGLVLADNLITLFIFWELTSITSFLLIGFNHASERSRRAALQALVVTGGGGLVMLAGLLLLAQVTQEFEMSAILQSGELLKESGLQNIILLLLIGGAFTKSAQFPFHFWLANAMEAPTPVSAYLHSATMVKAGVFLLMRIHPLFGDTPLWTNLLIVFGAATLVTGAILAVRQIDLKLMLAYTTIGSLGLLVFLLGVPHEKAVEGAVLYLLAHALFKGSLFMVVGIIDHETGSRLITKLGGLKRVMPATFVVACLAGLSMGGLPPFFGFIAKEVLYEGISHGPLLMTVATFLVVICNAVMLTIAALVALKPFLGAEVNSVKEPHEANLLLLLGPALLALLGLVSALIPYFTGETFIQPALSAVRGLETDIDLHLIPKIGIPLVLSIVTVILGVLIYLRISRLRVAMLKLIKPEWGPDIGFDRAVRLLLRFSSKVTAVVQFGSMKGYLTVTVLIVIGTMAATLTFLDGWPTVAAIPQFRFYEWAIFGLILIGMVTVLNAKNSMVAIVSMGIQGFAVAIIFMLFGAPDLSFTQFMVETLSVVILALVMTRLDLAPREYRSKGQRMFDGALAVGGGAVLCLTLIAATQVPFDSELSDFFEKFSRPLAHGRNIVNVILVDYRGVDTLGEIAVVMVAGLAVLALVRIATPKKSTSNEDRVLEKKEAKA